MNIKNKNIIKITTSSLMFAGTIFGMMGLSNHFSQNSSPFRNIPTLNDHEVNLNNFKNVSVNTETGVIPPEIGDFTEVKQTSIGSVTFKFVLKDGRETETKKKRAQIISISIESKTEGQKTPTVTPGITGMGQKTAVVDYVVPQAHNDWIMKIGYNEFSDKESPVKYVTKEIKEFSTTGLRKPIIEDVKAVKQTALYEAKFDFNLKIADEDKATKWKPIIESIYILDGELDVKIEVSPDQTTFGTKTVTMKNLALGEHDDFVLNVEYQAAASPPMWNADAHTHLVKYKIKPFTTLGVITPLIQNVSTPKPLNDGEAVVKFTIAKGQESKYIKRLPKLNKMWVESTKDGIIKTTISPDATTFGKKTIDMWKLKYGIHSDYVLHIEFIDDAPWQKQKIIITQKLDSFKTTTWEVPEIPKITNPVQTANGEVKFSFDIDHQKVHNPILRPAEITDIIVGSASQKNLKVNISPDKTAFGHKDVTIQNVTMGTHADFYFTVKFKDTAAWATEPHEKRFSIPTFETDGVMKPEISKVTKEVQTNNDEATFTFDLEQGTPSKHATIKSKITNVWLQSKKEPDVKLFLQEDKNTFGNKHATLKNLSVGKHSDFKLNVSYEGMFKSDTNTVQETIVSYLLPEFETTQALPQTSTTVSWWQILSISLAASISLFISWAIIKVHNSKIYSWIFKN